MRDLVISAMGAFTPVGVDVPQTMGSLLSRLQWFDDLDLLGALGEPITGARVRLRAGDDPLERYVGMSHFALSECQRAGDAAATAARAAPRAGAAAAGDVARARSPLGAVAPARLGPRGGRRHHRLRHQRGLPRRPHGRVGALATARELLRAGRATSCYVGGVDSLLDPVRLHELLADGRLADGPGRTASSPARGPSS